MGEEEGGGLSIEQKEKGYVRKIYIKKSKGIDCKKGI
jgi:hypothetical protein